MNEQMKLQHVLAEVRNKAEETWSKEAFDLFEESLELPFVYVLAQYKKAHHQHLYMDEVKLFNYFFEEFQTTKSNLSLLELLDELILHSFGIEPSHLHDLVRFVDQFNDTYAGMSLPDFVPLAVQNGFDVLHSENGHTVWYNGKNVMLLPVFEGKTLVECHVLFVKENACLPLVFHSHDSLSFHDNALFHYRFHRFSTCNNIFHVISQSAPYIESTCSEVDLMQLWRELTTEEVSDLFGNRHFVRRFFHQINTNYEKQFN